MRIGFLQFDHQVGDVNNNFNRADSVLSKANPDGLDLLILPELDFLGESSTLGDLCRSADRNTIAPGCPTKWSFVYSDRDCAPGIETTQ